VGFFINRHSFLGFSFRNRQPEGESPLLQQKGAPVSGGVEGQLAYGNFVPVSISNALM
jgi:hypothetical protein